MAAGLLREGVADVWPMTVGLLREEVADVWPAAGRVGLSGAGNFLATWWDRWWAMGRILPLHWRTRFDPLDGRIRLITTRGCINKGVKRYRLVSIPSL